MTLVWAYNFKQIQRLQDVFEEIVSLEIVSIIANCLFSQKKLWWSWSQYICDICIGTLVINVFPNLSSAIFFITSWMFYPSYNVYVVLRMYELSEIEYSSWIEKILGYPKIYVVTSENWCNIWRE